MKSVVKYFASAALVLGAVLICGGFAVDAQEREGAKPRSFRIPATLGRPVKTHPEKPDPARPTFLELEEAAAKRCPEVEEEGIAIKEYARRMPLFWRELELSERQIARTYKIHKAYYERIAVLQARVDRLLREREEAMKALLDDDQLAALEILTQEAKDKRAKKKDAPKDVDEEDEDEEEVEEDSLEDEEDEEDEEEFEVLM